MIKARTLIILWVGKHSVLFEKASIALKSLSIHLLQVENLSQPLPTCDLCLCCEDNLSLRKDFLNLLPKHVSALFLDVEDELSLLKLLPEYSNHDYITTPYDDSKFLFKIKKYQAILETKQHEQYLLNLAKYDVVTGLANRQMFFDVYRAAKARAKKNHKTLALLLIEIHNYQVLHSTLGHDALDDLLEAFAKRLTDHLKDTELASRLGTEKFGILVPDLDNPTDASGLAQALYDIVSKPFMHNHEQIFLRVAIGIALDPFDTNTNHDIEGCAEMALLQSKTDHHNAFCYFESHMQAYAHERLNLEKGLKEAQSKGEFSLLYQPKVGAMSGLIEGAEALLRWQSPKWGIVAPDKFIPIAEEVGLIEEIGHWVLSKAVEDAKAWLSQGVFDDQVVAVNVSAHQLSRPDFVEILKNVLALYEFPAQQLEIEITESCLMDDPVFCVNQLNQIRDLGVHIAIDDFGTGFSSLTYLRYLPIHTLKIDKSFVSALGKQDGGEEIIKVILSLCKIFNLNTVAEGVETDEELIYLRALQCDTIQGYYYSKPITFVKMAQLLAKQPFETFEHTPLQEYGSPFKKLTR